MAEKFDGEIVNCDSLQVYRHFDIGTAKLPPAQRRGIPHHLIDILNPDQLCHRRRIRAPGACTIAEISARGRLPILAGGTGFYLRALLEGLFEGPVRDQPLRDRLAAREARRPGSLHRLLRRFDSTAAGKIHANDIPKVTRALEICLLTRQPVSRLFQQGRDALTGYRTLKLGLLPDREALNPRLDERCAWMFEHGLVEEVRCILALGFSPACKPFESHGYKQAMQFIQGELSLRDAIFYAQRNTRHYAKRQITWFRRERELQWLKGFGDAPDIREAALTSVSTFLNACD